MANRLELLSERIKKVPRIVSSSFDFLELESLLTKEENVDNRSFRILDWKLENSWRLKWLPNFTNMWKKQNSLNSSSPTLRRWTFSNTFSKHPTADLFQLWGKDASLRSSPVVILESPPCSWLTGDCLGILSNPSVPNSKRQITSQNSWAFKWWEDGPWQRIP